MRCISFALKRRRHLGAMSNDRFVEMFTALSCALSDRTERPLIDGTASDHRLGFGVGQMLADVAYDDLSLPIIRQEMN